MKKIKHNITKSIYLLAAISLFGGTGQPAAVFASGAGTGDTGKTIQIEKIFESSDQHDNGREKFENTYEKDGITYSLKKIETSIASIKGISGTPYYYDSEIFTDDPKNHKPAEEVEKEDGTYILKSAELIEDSLSERTKYVEANTDYLVEYIDTIPETNRVEVLDEDTDQKTLQYLPLLHTEIVKERWDNNFLFPITISGYDADEFMLGDTVVRRGDDLMEYADSFLEYLNLPAEFYQILGISWDGNPYEQDGEIMRNANAIGRKLVRDVRATYGGMASLPELDGTYYHCQYVKKGTTEGTVYTIKAVAMYEEEGNVYQSFWDWLLEWLKAHPIATICITLLLFFLIATIIFFLLSLNEENKKEPEIKFIELGDSENDNEEDVK